MRKIVYFLLLMLVGCDSQENNFEEVEAINSHFRNYIYQEKEVIHNDNKTLNYKTETTLIGKILIDSIEYIVLMEFRKIQCANSVRGRSSLYFVGESNSDTLEYDLSMPDNLPIDIYEGYFAFKREEDSTYVFSKLELEVKNIICFDCIECYTSNRSYDTN
jgi:hypothetical protein